MTPAVREALRELAVAKRQEDRREPENLRYFWAALVDAL